MLNREEVLDILPQGDPFVFVDNATVYEDRVEGSYTITGDECFMPGHFPNRPVFPASIMVEAIGQLGIVFMMEHLRDQGIDRESIYMIKSEDAMCRRKCFPGDRLDMTMRMLRVREPLMQFTGEIRVNGELALKVSSISLSFSTQGQS
jgi:3-hydroxymyristoyl/3-hydroxydecanoyl-(acyl carrier protein) dehydratases